MALRIDSQTLYWQKSIPSFITQCNVLLGKKLAFILTENNIQISAEQWIYFILLAEAEGPTQQELSAKSFRSKPAVTIAMDTLERLQLIERRSDEFDRRINRIYLTELGRAEYEKARAHIEKLQLTYFKGFDTTEMIQLESGLAKLAANIAAEYDPKS